MQSGQSLTPFVLDALLDVPADVKAAPGRDRAGGRVHQTQSERRIARAERDTLDYPNYATGLRRTRAVPRKVEAGSPARKKCSQALRLQQFTEQNGWHRDDPPYGAWGMGGQIRTPPGCRTCRSRDDAVRARRSRRSGSASAGRRASESAGVYRSAARIPMADSFFRRSRLDTNKAGEGARHEFRSYGSTTADGILALRAAGAGGRSARDAREDMAARPSQGRSRAGVRRQSRATCGRTDCDSTTPPR